MDGAAQMDLLIDTGVVAPSDRADFWAQSSGDVYHPLQIRTDRSDRFSARMWGQWLDSVGVFRVAAGANTMCRTRREIAAGDPEHLHLSLLLRGQLQGAQARRSTLLRPGDMTTYDTSQPAIFRAPEPFDLLVLKLPKQVLGDRARRIERLTAVTIPGRPGTPRLAGRYFCRVAVGLANGTVSGADGKLAQTILDLVLRLYSDAAGRSSGTAAPRAELLLQAQAFIEANLSDPALGPEQVARGCFISTRYLHRLFHDEGLSVCEWIRTARLERCRRDLVNPGLSDRSISSIAGDWGLTSAQHFSRLFRATYGCSAREMRKTVREATRTAS